MGFAGTTPWHNPFFAPPITEFSNRRFWPTRDRASHVIAGWIKRRDNRAAALLDRACHTRGLREAILVTGHGNPALRFTRAHPPWTRARDRGNQVRAPKPAHNRAEQVNCAAGLVDE